MSRQRSSLLVADSNIASSSVVGRHAGGQASSKQREKHGGLETRSMNGDAARRADNGVRTWHDIQQARRRRRLSSMDADKFASARQRFGFVGQFRRRGTRLYVETLSSTTPSV